VKRTVVEAVARQGAGVINADDPLVAVMAEYCSGEVIYFTRRQDNPVVRTHLAKGGRAVFVRDSKIILACGAEEESLMPLVQAALTRGGRVGLQIENTLAAAAAAWALGIPLDTIRAALATFSGDANQAPGRFNVLTNGDATVIIDYAHNPSALSALVEALDGFPHQRRTLVFSGFNRTDAEMVTIGTTLANGFDRVILYEDRGNHDRQDGELNALIRRGLSVGSRVSEVIDTVGEIQAIATALESQQPGELLVIGTEAIEDSLAFVQPFLAARATAKHPDLIDISRGTPE